MRTGVVAVVAAAEKAMLVKFPAEDGRIKLARINCEADMALCKKNHIQAFPSIRIFRAGNDLLVVRPLCLPSPSATCSACLAVPLQPSHTPTNPVRCLSL